jgi:integrase
LDNCRVQEEEQIEEEQEQEDNVDPYTLFVYGIRSPYTKESYFRRLRGFFDAINLDKGRIFEDRCNTFAYKGRNNSSWAFNNIIRFLYCQKERVERKEITAGTLHNYIKTLKMFCEVTDIVIAWKKITRGLPKGRMYADDRAPTLEEIHKIIQYPDRRIKPIVCTMASSGIRVGAWDYLKWNHISPVLRDSKLVAAKVKVYAGEDDEYTAFITPEAYLALESWMTYRNACGENIAKDSWVMRDLWNAAKLPRKQENGKINEPVKLQSIGVKRLIERALWAQGVRTVLVDGKKRHEFQTDHGFRKWYKTQCEMAGMKSINIEKLMGHSLGMSTNSYYRATSDQILEDYLKAVPFLTISSENKLQQQIEEFREQSKIKSDDIKSQLYEKGQAINNLTESNSTNTDAIAALSDQILKLTKEIEMLKNVRATEEIRL